ncbi:LacI family transcriptional regulator [Prauserella marina]|uniref:LacI family transcriptional regulator n=2 Tax=Prauserella marina TaxID=530584 RepID=A0A1G6RLF9_9PSEU|nr:LacI family DNA-binding transcriptional regulator [Prauserella marina]PWV77117.1 LacI family transcriptional regulator [Prauserella marina]SDD04815.1 LacI family transcriptional regulator [Prauserella marina]
MESRRVTLKDIAKSLGVSVNTVSRALTGKDSVGEDTRTRIKEEARRLGYVPNSMARSLVLGSAMTLGLVITNPSNPFYARLISTIEQRGRVHGYSLMLLVTEESQDGDEAAAETLLRWGVDGALVVPVQSDGEHWDRLDESGVPVVCLNRDFPALELDFIGVDYDNAAYEATRHLIDGGARSLCLLEEDLPISPVADRTAGFRRALADAGLGAAGDPVLSVPTRRQESLALPWDPGDAYRIAQDIVSGGDLPDAIMVGNDYFALGVYRALNEAGLSAPRDVLVGGFGDHPFAAYLSPPLTTVRLPAADIGTTAVDVLLRRMKGSAGQPEKRRLPSELVVRASSRTGESPPT